MRTSVICWLIGITALFSLTARAAVELDDAFVKGNNEYAAGHFREAADRYESLASAGETSAGLFYNLGNARYRAGDFGQAILNYERALALEPHHPEAQTNLRLARDKARALELQKTPVERVLRNVTPTELTVGGSVGCWLVAFAGAALLLGRRRSGRVTTLLVLSILLLAASVAALYLRETGNNGRALAIVIGQKIEARLATADNAGTVLALPPGSEIKILSTRGDWVYAALPNNLRGWIPAQSAQLVRL